MRNVFVAAGMAVVAASAGAGETGPSVEVGGTLSGVAWNSDAPLLHRDSGVGGRLQLELRAHAADWTGFVRTDTSSSDDLADSRGINRIRESWVRYRGVSADVTLGRQMMPSGRADVIILQDQFAPRDLTQLTLTDAEQQLGVTAARLDVYPTDALTISGAFVHQDRSYVLPRSFGGMSPAWSTLAGDPASATMLRMEYRTGGWEFAATATRGASPLPGLSLASGAPVATDPKEERLSFDGTVSIGKDVLRWDFVYASDDTSGMPGFSHRRRALAVGWDSGLWRDANLSLQAVVRRDDLEQPEAASVPELADVFDANTRLSQAFRRTQRYLTATFKQRIRSEHQLETGVLFGSGGQRGLVQRWIWQPWDGYAFQAKAQFVHGESDTLLGNLGFRKILYAEFRYQF